MSFLRQPALWALLATAGIAVGLLVGTADADSTKRVIMAFSLVATGLAGLGLAIAVRRWGARLPLGGQLALIAVSGAVVLVANIAVSARLMFISTHDLQVLYTLCGYALVVVLGPSLVMSRGLSDRIKRLEEAARRLAGGELTARVAVTGDDELGMLATEFNRMASALELANRRRDALEGSRRNLFAAISHDLRTPLASIRVIVEALRDGVAADEPTRQRYFETASLEVDRLSVRIDDLFELTTIDSGELQLRLESLDMREVIAGAVDSLRPQAESAGISLAFERATECATVHADAYRLTRVLENLLQNAIRHTPYDGTIVLRTEVAPEAVWVIVADSGEGIAPEDLPHVFERFYRGDPARSRGKAGSGLGLAIARGIVEAHGGRIWVESAQGHGSTFGFSIPALTTSVGPN